MTNEPSDDTDARHSSVDLDCALAAVEALDLGICVFTPDFTQALYANRTFRRLIDVKHEAGEPLPSVIAEHARDYASSRRSLGHLPNAMRIERSDGTGLWLRVLRAPDPWHYEVVIIREETLRDPALFRELQARYGITRREFQIIAGIRLGKTNRLLAKDLGVSEHHIEKLVSRLLERFGLPNRMQLAKRVEEIAFRRG